MIFVGELIACVPWQVLKRTSEAMTAKELTQAAIDKGYISTNGKVRLCLLSIFRPIPNLAYECERAYNWWRLIFPEACRCMPYLVSV